MKAILEFTLPDEAQEHSNAVHGAQWRFVVGGIDEQCRTWLKHGCPFTSVEDVLKSIRQQIIELSPEID